MSTPSIRHHLPLAVVSSSPSPLGKSEDSAGEHGLLQVGALAKAVGKTVRAIHLYEELGLVRPYGRSKGKYRLFDQDAMVRVRWICKLQELGLSLGEIQNIVRAWEHAPSAPGAMKQMRDVYRTKLAETTAQRVRFEALEEELQASLTYLETCDSCDPARLLNACTVCDMHTPAWPAPELVAGFHAGQGTASVSSLPSAQPVEP